MTEDQQFFSTAAQVIPVFVLALVFEYRYFREDGTELASRSLFLLSFLIALAGGEWGRVSGSGGFEEAGVASALS